MTNPVYSIIAPIFNESGNIQELYRRLREVLDTTGEDWELIMVDDGSTDDSASLIRQYAEEDSLELDLRWTFGDPSWGGNN